MAFQSSRRAFMKKGLFGLAALPLGMGALTSQAFAERKQITEDNPAAAALGYVKESTTEGQYCDNCIFWEQGNNPPESCSLLQPNNFRVEAKGWCERWVAG
ncbi:High potential iron-sulfur protein [Marinospirillum celere]|uniref:High-potential iron-sulfur protein n=1 Tax=Marinospirillum celere TaxID=1122252 RepID=A0A1I1E165_9GAMM|nr:high-potential iron-sulfur protein [Marinospirillum celere]SFB78978.1 High potential iron-sulfur protein [Marinospirillum celere]